MEDSLDWYRRRRLSRNHMVIVSHCLGNVYSEGRCANEGANSSSIDRQDIHDTARAPRVHLKGVFFFLMVRAKDTNRDMARWGNLHKAPRAQSFQILLFVLHVEVKS